MVCCFAQTHWYISRIQLKKKKREKEIIQTSQNNKIICMNYKKDDDVIIKVMILMQDAFTLGLGFSLCVSEGRAAAAFVGFLSFPFFPL